MVRSRSGKVEESKPYGVLEEGSTTEVWFRSGWRMVIVIIIMQNNNNKRIIAIVACLELYD